MTYSQVQVQADGTLSDVQQAPVLDLAAAKRRFAWPVYAWVIAFLGVFVWASYDIYLALPLTISLHERFIQGAPITSGYFSYFEILTFGMAVLLLERFGFRFFSARPLVKTFFLFAVLCVFLDLLNPNDGASKQLGLPILANIDSYVYLTFMFMLFFLRDEGFFLFLKRALVAVSILVVTRAFVLLALWAMGGGNYSFGAGSTLTEGDSLAMYAFFSLLFLALYFIRGRLVYLLMWATVVALQVLSFRRSALYILIGSNLFLLLLRVLVRSNLGAIMRNLAVGVFVLVLGGLIVLETVPEDISEYYFNRYFGIFLGLGQGEQTKYAGDSGHFAESANTLAYAVERMDFWGYGSGNDDRIYIPGATGRLYVHNVFAASWLYHGIYQFLFYAFLGFIVILLGLKIFFQRRRYDERFVLLIGGLLGFLGMLLIVWYTNPIHMAEALKMRVLWLGALACILRIKPSHIGILFDDPPAAAAVGQTPAQVRAHP